MPRAVKGALLFALMEEGGMGDEEGKEYLMAMEEEGRLMEECWS
jgi:sulfite reductase alpha subunit-like flavoprotein